MAAGATTRAPNADRVYLLGAGVLWAILMVVDAAFLILAMAIFAPLCLHHLGVALVMTLLIVGGVFWQALALLPRRRRHA